MFARFGVQVTVVEAMPRLLAAEEPEAGETLATILRREGVNVVVGAKATSIESRGEMI